MAVGVTGQTQIDDAVRTFLSSAIFTQEQKGVMLRCVDNQTLPHGQGRAWNEPYWPSIVAESLTDTVAIASPIQITDAKITITPAEVGLQVIFTRRMADTISENFASVVGELTANAVEYKKDRDLLNMLDGFGGVVGGATVSLSVGLVGSAAAANRVGRAGTRGSGTAVARTGARTTGDNGDQGPMFGVFHEYNRYDLGAQLSGLGGTTQLGAGAASVANYPSTAGLTSDQMNFIRNNFAGSVMGVDVIIDNNFDFQSAGGTWIKGGVFAKMALVFVKFRTIEVDKTWDPDRRSWKFTVTEDYGIGERNDVWGTEVDVDVTAPTG